METLVGNHGSFFDETLICAVFSKENNAQRSGRYCTDASQKAQTGGRDVGNFAGKPEFTFALKNVIF